MQDNLVSWNAVGMIIVLVLVIYAGIKTIDRLFEKSNKKKNSLF